MKKLLSASSLVVLCGGLVATSPSIPVSAEIPLVLSQSSSTPGASSKIELLDPGSEPRQQLRVQPNPNTQQKTTLTMNMSTSVTVNDQALPKMDMPTIQMIMEANTEQVDPNGDMHIKLSYSDVNVANNTTLPPQVVEAFRDQLKKITEINISYVMDKQGITKDVQVVFPEDLDPNIKQVIGQLLDSLEQLSASPFPKEAIGVGSKWQLSNSLGALGIPVDNFNVLYELQDLQADNVTLKISMNNQFDPSTGSALNIPGLPAGLNSTIKALDIQSTGTITSEFDKILPKSGTISTTSNMEFALKQPNSNQEMKMKMNSAVDITIGSPQ